MKKKYNQSKGVRYSLKEKIYRIISPEIDKSFWSQVFNIAITTLIILSVLAIILESFQSLNERYGYYFHIFEITTVIIFTGEYLLRIWVSNYKYDKDKPVLSAFKFITSFEGLIDLMAIIPFFLPLFIKMDLRFIRILRVLRLLLVLKLGRHTKSLQLVIRVISEKRGELGITIFVTMVLLVFSSTIMYYLENEVQPDNFPNIVATFWWAIATLTTVGYGDVYPVTAWGKLFGGIIALLGIGLVALPTGILSSAFIEKVEKDNKTPKIVHQPSNKAYKYCPHCGEELPH